METIENQTETSPLIAASIERPCFKCEHCRDITPRNGHSFHVCTRQIVKIKYNPVTGMKTEFFTNCYKMRSEGSTCGPLANLFTPIAQLRS
jgi:hypothetical protein